MGETVNILRATRERLSNPARWMQGGGGSSDGPRCVDLALWDAGDRDTMASQAVRRVLGLDTTEGNVHHLFRWNDAPERTHADILDALDRAIEAEATA